MRRYAIRACVVCTFLALVFAVALRIAAYSASERAVRPLIEDGCEPLQVTDRHGRMLRAVPAQCEHRGRGLWASLSEIPTVARDAVVVSEDRRFAFHPGVDPLAMARAAFENLMAGRVVSGASTLTMQLMRMVHHPRAERTLSSKLKEAWLALGAESRLCKQRIIEAYLNHAYYGNGAYGMDEAARIYFGKPARALTDGEATLLAVLPRAPGAYDPVRHLDRALRRRSRVLEMLVSTGRLSEAKRRRIESETLYPQVGNPHAVFEAPHFVDWVLTTLPEARQKAGGLLTTTLDLGLQQRLERAVADHLHRVAPQGVTQAGVVVLDTATSEIRAMVGSGRYRSGQINIAVRRRHPGSLLKPFVYALAIEKGASPATVAFDVGDVTSEFQARDWVGREGGPVRMSEALAGSYNLAAVHVLEGVGVGALHERLRRAGVAEASLPPESYGLKLALGSARVRLLDAAAGFGFLVREGMVRRPRAVRSLRYRDRSPWHPPAADEVRVFSPEVSWLVMDMLGDPAARHRRFGRGLPLEGAGRVAAKTGTASGLSDITTVLASREWIVGAWTGRFDGSPARGTSGMWAAAPLARLAMDIALDGREPTLPERPRGLIPVRACALSGQPAGPDCPSGIHTQALKAPKPGKSCQWHSRGADGIEVTLPEQLQGWMARARVLRPGHTAEQR